MCPIRRTVKKVQDKTTGVINKIPIIEDLQRELDREHSLSVSVNRSKNNLYRISRSNEWDLFITLTFDRSKVDSSNYDLCLKKVQTWLNNLKKRKCPNLKYLCVPELHSDKKHYHFHGLLANIDGLDLIDSGHSDFLGEKIYNISESWIWGFSTATFIKDNNRVTSYIGKYITKDLMNNIKYKNRYIASRNCNVVPEVNYMIPPDEVWNFLDPDNCDFIKSITIDKVNRVTYLEYNNNIDIPDKYKV